MLAGMNMRKAAALTVRREILRRMPPGPERQRWLAWLTEKLRVVRKRR
jgi:hypothetical protein